jgi:hypothetical protein
MAERPGPNVFGQVGVSSQQIAQPLYGASLLKTMLSEESERLLIARNDFSECKSHMRSYLEFSGDPKHLDAYGLLGLDLCRRIEFALLQAAIVAYARPFVKSRGSKWSSIPNRLTKSFTKRHREIHKYLLLSRKKLIAHSDTVGVQVRRLRSNNDIPLNVVQYVPVVIMTGEVDSLDIGKASRRHQDYTTGISQSMKEILDTTPAENMPSELSVLSDRMIEIDQQNCEEIIQMAELVDKAIGKELRRSDTM